MFNWQTFLTAHGVPFVLQGAKELSVHCPFCGTADHSEHLSISLRGAGWRCLRNPRAHAGRSRSRLIQALLKVSQDEARRLAEEAPTPSPVDEDFVSHLAGLMGDKNLVELPRLPLKFPVEFKPLAPLTNSVVARQFWEYLKDRGYSLEDRGWIAHQYNLHYVIPIGPYCYRLIIPIYAPDGQLMTWTARSILPNEKFRYKTLPTRPPYNSYDGPLAVAAPGALLLGLPLLLRTPNPEVLVLCEGPFDAFRITALGRHIGVYGTCLFGLNISDAQVALLDRLMVRFKRLVLLLDPDAELISFRIKEHLTPLVVRSGRLPAGVEDPGALPYAVGRELVQSWL